MLLLLALTVSACDSLPPAVIPDKVMVCCGESSLIAAGLAIALRVGATFAGLTVTVNSRENDLSSLLPATPSGPASRTVTVIFAVPLLLATGVYLSVPVVLGDT